MDAVAKKSLSTSAEDLRTAGAAELPFPAQTLARWAALVTGRPGDAIPTQAGVGA